MRFVRPIVKEGDPVLRRVAKKVDPAEIADPLFQQMIDDMFETMYAAPGVGLAAPQINVSKRLFVIDTGEDEEHPEGTKHVVINPKIESAHEEVDLNEGCLSVPGLIGDIVRYERVAVTGLDREGKRIRLEGSDLFAQALQHEIDHLNGVLYIDKAKNIRAPASPKEEREEEEL
jgi:peptide deformylase